VETAPKGKRFLVASERAELLPLAHRLRREGQEVEALVWRPRYENAWGGSIEKVVRHSDGTIVHEALAKQIDAAKVGELTVVTTVDRVAELFQEAKHFYGQGPREATSTPDRLLLGAWFNGEEIEAPHLLIADWGVWPGGFGPAVLGGLTLIRLGGLLPAFVQGALQAATDRMKSESFRGLFHFDVVEVPQTGELRLQNLACGWPWLQTQCFVAELQSLSETLAGSTPVLGHRFVSCLPVTIPPWPNEKRSDDKGGIPIEGLTSAQQGKLFWFDVQIDVEHRKLRTAGLDGLLGVATGASDSTPALARSRALELAARLQVPAKQVRADAFAMVDSVLATLEDRYGFVV
jgi:hypothetical protein